MAALREALGSVGVWSMEMRRAARPEVQEAAAELDDLGFPGLWLPGLDGNGVLSDVEHLLAAAPRATIAMGILSIWGEQAPVLAKRIAALDSAYGPRVAVGLGVSNASSAAAAAQEYGSPTVSMSHFLDQLDEAAAPVAPARRFLGALGPKMVDLAAARTAGWHPFLVTPEYSAHHRPRVGPEPVIAPHQAVVLDPDPDRARAAARAGIGMFIGFPAYQANLRRLGFGDADLIPGGSDRLIDALTAWGDLDDVGRRIQEHLDAGADHVALHVLNTDRGPADRPPALPRRQWRELAALIPTLARH